MFLKTGERRSGTAERICAPQRVGRKALATFLHQATLGTTYWRCALPAKYLPGNLLPSSELELLKHPDGSFEWKNFDVPVIMQFPGDRATAISTMIAEGEGRKLYVEVDDNYLTANDPLWHKRSGWGARIGETGHTIEGHRWIVQHAHGVIVTTKALFEDYAELNPNVYICRNSIDPDDWPPLSKPDDGVFRIGWYASGSHDRDQAPCRRAMAWASRQPNVEIVNIGLSPSGWNFPRRQVGWADDFLALRPELMKLDVGIAPLVRNANTRFRSDVKALEYAMAGAMPILQAMEPYEEWHEVDEASLCWTEKDWDDSIRWAVTHRDEVRENGLGARDWVLAKRTFSTEIERWREALEF